MPRSRNALEIKGRMLSVTRLKVVDADPAAIKSQLELLASQMPQAVRGMPVVIDCEIDADLPALLELARGAGMQPLGVSEGPLAAEARRLGLAVLSRDSGKNAPATAAAPAEPPVAKAAPAAAPDPAERRPTRIVAEPVRSGQQVYADGCDLIVLNAVSPGAEVIADGCVHVYGKLAGRAIAGARGDERARIFCRRMEAELVAIAGVYAVADQIKDGPRGQPAQAYLEQGRLRIEAHKV
jgi:septum site-determining protein MinC